MMKYAYRAAKSGSSKNSAGNIRDRVLLGGAVFVVLAIGIRLGQLQIAQSGFYKSLASGQHDIFSKLLPERGEIMVRDRATGALYPVAANRDLWTLYSDNRKLGDARAESKALAPLLAEPIDAKDKKPEEAEALTKAGLEAKEADILKRLSLANDPYEQLARGLSQELADRIKALNLPNLGFAAEKSRFYPETDFGGQVLGFVGYQGNQRAGRYGVEGYWNKELAGVQGYLSAKRDPNGTIIAGDDNSIREKIDGSNIVLTIDRTLQAYVCTRLAAWVKEHSAESGSVVMLNPSTGAVLAMCGVPDFDPNAYGKAADASAYNNSTIWNAYEPGSVMKTVTMAGAIDSGAVMPTTTFNDPGEERYGEMIVRNSDHISHGIQTMVDVLDKSLNTGAIFAMRKTGIAKFQSYVNAFGFGVRTGIELDTESPGNLSSMKKMREVDSATASFGQGITVTALQMATAYGAIANSGKLMKPYVVGEIVHPDGVEIKTQPQMVRQVISAKTASLVSGMLVSVVKNGHGKRAGVSGYLVAGKTGTAQVPKVDGLGYDETATIGTFAGFAPVSDPKFVMVVRIDKPKDVQFAESSAAPLWGDIAAFALKYLEVPPDDVR
jgi:cell division protein FtsI/penicillin-binding protein 2